MISTRKAYHDDPSLKKEVLREEGIPLSGNAMKAFAAPGTHLFLEKELAGKDREWMLGPIGAYIMLYEFPGKDVGHWICGWQESDGSIKHFDAYGKAPNHYTEEKPYLNVLEEGPYTYSKHDFQSHNPNMDTCGRHALVRLMFKEYTDAQYAGLVHRNGNADEEVTLMTLHITERYK
jgi:hypothetical protein